jgi:hypothetical protein
MLLDQMQRGISRTIGSKHDEQSRFSRPSAELSRGRFKSGEGVNDRSRYDEQSRRGRLLAELSGTNLSQEKVFIIDPNMKSSLGTTQMLSQFLDEETRNVVEEHSPDTENAFPSLGQRHEISTGIGITA